MSEHGTGIEWTHLPGFKGETWNPTTGCDIVSLGCINCYALDQAARLKRIGVPAYQNDGNPKTSGPGFDLTMHEDRLGTPRRWSKPRAVFVNSMSDLFHERVDPAFIGEVFRTMRDTPQHIYMILTKRPERMREVLSMAPLLFAVPLPNVWLGVSIENSRFTWRADVLREIPAAKRFISAEPLLGSLFKTAAQEVTENGSPSSSSAGGSGSQVGNARDAAQSGADAPRAKAPLDLTAIDWIIVGGESGGKDVRPMHPDWVQEIRDACADVRERASHTRWADEFGNIPAFFFKQWGSWAPGEADYAGSHLTGNLRVTREGTLLDYQGRRRDTNELSTFQLPADWEKMAYMGASPKSGGKLLDGRQWCEFPDIADQLSLTPA